MNLNRDTDASPSGTFGIRLGSLLTNETGPVLNPEIAAEPPRSKSVAPLGAKRVSAHLAARRKSS